MHADPLVERWARGRLAHGFSLDAAATVTGTSKRTHARRLQAVRGNSPLSFVQALRVERAVHLPKTMRDSADAIAAHVGDSDAVALRNLLRRQPECGIRAIRRGGPGGPTPTKGS